MTRVNFHNAEIAEKLDEVARILEIQNANAFRVAAYRRAAETIRGLDVSLDDLVTEEGIAGLDALPGIGSTLARLLFQLVTTRRLPLLERLRGTLDPISILTTVPGIGKRSAQILHSDLGIDSLEELEVAVHDGRLAQAGFPAKRIAGIRDSLSVRLGRRPARFDTGSADEPFVSEILSVDREYRNKAAKDELHKIMPRRFNPERRAWLPILHTARGKHQYTALFSNTALAHQLHKTDDWVVIYFENDDSHRQYTVTTAERGDLSGKRIVRGREQECRVYYFGNNGITIQRDNALTEERNGRQEDLYDDTKKPPAQVASKK